MIFKTLLTDLSKVTAVVTNLKEVSALVNGASGLLNKDSVTGLSSAIKGLNIQQAQLALSFKHLTQEQMNQVLVQAGLIASEDKIQAELLQTALAQSALSEEQKKSILTKLKLINAETGEILVDKSCTKEKLLEVLATKGITGAKADEIVTTLGLTGSNAGLAISYEVVRKAASRFFGTLLKNPLTWVIAGITAASVVLYKVAKASDEVAKKAQNLSEEFNSSSTSITDFKKRIDELHKVINDSNSSVEEVKEARVNLLSVQDEIIDKFGDEKEVIDAVTDAINNQSDALNNLTQKEWTDSLNDFNKEGFWNSIGNWINGYDSNAERMLDTYGDYSISLDLFDFSYGYTNEEYNKFIETLKKDFGADVSSSLGMATFTGNASEVHEILLGIQGIAKDFEFSDKFNKQLTKAANAAKDVSNKYKDMYNQYILYEEVLPNYKDQYNELTDAYSAYKEAWTSGDVDAQNKAIEIISNALQNASTNIDNKYVVDFFENMYPELQSVIDKWEFKAKIIPMVDTKPLQGKTDADILEMLTTDNLQDGESTFNYIVNRALENDIIPDTSQKSIQTVIDLLIELGVIERTIVDSNNDVAATFSDIFAMEDAEGNLNDLGKLNEKIDELQNNWSGLKEMMDNYNSTGTITMDQFQELLSYGDEYLQYLVDEKGNLQLNEEALMNVASARINELKARLINDLYSQITSIKNEADAREFLKGKINESTGAIEENTEATLENMLAHLSNAGLTEGTLSQMNEWVTNAYSSITTLIGAIDINSFFTSGSSTSPSDILDKEITALEKAAEAGTITYKEYLSERERLVNDYYKHGKIKAEEYYAELEELAQARVDYYDKVLAAIERRFDREIDAIQDTIENLEKQNEQLEKQKNLYDSALDAIQNFIDTEKEKHQDQIDNIESENDEIDKQIQKYDQLLNAVTLVFDEKKEAIQSEIDILDERIEKLQEENDEYQKAIELEKAKEALLKSQQQRTKMLNIYGTFHSNVD